MKTILIAYVVIFLMTTYAIIWCNDSNNQELKYDKPIFYIGTQIASNLMTIRTYVEEYNPDHHDYRGSVYSFNLQEIVNTINHIRDEFIQIRSSVPVANQSLTGYQKNFGRTEKL